MRRVRARGDDGAMLIIAMLIVTAIALVVGAVVGQADAGVRATLALRDQAGSDYNGDGAAQVAINTLRNSTFNNATGSTCFASGSTLMLPKFYPATNGQYGSAQSSAAVVCSAEAGTGAQGSPVTITSANKPGQAILTLSTSASETGQTYGQSNKTITVHGAVTSDSNIDASHANLNVTGGVAIKSATGCSPAANFSPSCTTASAISDPNYAAPTTTPAAPSTPVCPTANNGPEVFSPGLYRTDPPSVTPVTKSNGTSGTTCDKNIGWYYFKPGQYYFDFTGGGSHIWTTSKTTVAGTLVNGGTSPSGSLSAPGVPGACVNPIDSTSAVGVQFAFGGDTQLSFGNGTNTEFCATYSQNSIPTVFYGLKADVGSGSNIAHAESGCVITVGGCYLISNPSNGSQPSFYFEGFVYTPKGALNLQVTNAAQPYFNFGIISRTLALSTTGSACATCAYISLPDNSPGLGTASTVVDLSVYVCPGQSTCSGSTGKLALTARVKIDDPNPGQITAGARKITVLSWAEQR